MQASQTSPLHRAVLHQDPRLTGRRNRCKETQVKLLEGKGRKKLADKRWKLSTALAECPRWPRTGTAPDGAASNTNRGTCGTAALPGPYGTCSGTAARGGDAAGSCLCPRIAAAGTHSASADALKKQRVRTPSAPREGPAAGPGAARPEGLQSPDPSRAGHGAGAP